MARPVPTFSCRARGVRVLSFVGRSGTGKTTLIERLIPLLASKGIRIATIKHYMREFDIDREGKDSYRTRRRGLSSP